MKGIVDMGSFIARQPNGLLCRFSSIVECVTQFNFTDEDYKNNITGTVSNLEQAQDIIDNHIKPFKRVIEDTTMLNMSNEEFEDFLQKTK